MNIIFAEMIQDDKIKGDFLEFIKEHKVHLMTSASMEHTCPTDTFRETLNLKDEDLRTYLLTYYFVRCCFGTNLLFEMMSRTKALTNSESVSLNKFLSHSDELSNQYYQFVKERNKLKDIERRNLKKSLEPVSPYKIISAFKNFEDKYTSVSQFLKDNNIRCTGEELLDFLQEKGYATEYSLLKKLKDDSLAKQKERFASIKFVVEREYDRILNGIEENGEIRAYDMLDYYENCKFTKNEFISYCKKFNLRITADLHKFFKFPRTCSAAEILSTKYIIWDREITEDEKIKALDYLRSRKILISSLMFRLALKRVLD